MNSRSFIWTSTLASLLTVSVACEKSVEDEVEDLREARRQHEQDIQKAKEKLQEQKQKLKELQQGTPEHVKEARAKLREAIEETKMEIGSAQALLDDPPPAAPSASSK